MEHHEGEYHDALHLCTLRIRGILPFLPSPPPTPPGPGSPLQIIPGQFSCGILARVLIRIVPHLASSTNVAISALRNLAAEMNDFFFLKDRAPTEISPLPLRAPFPF